MRERKAKGHRGGREERFEANGRCQRGAEASEPVRL
jgi:hypothetical protein